MLLTVDIGTSNFKSALWDYDGNCLSFASQPLLININEGERHEAECSQWLRAFENCCQKLGNLSKVEAVIISGNGPSLIPVLGETFVWNGKLAVSAENARLWLDTRAVKYAEVVTDVMGGFVGSGFFLPKILHIKNEEPELYRKTKCFLGVPEYLAFALTGQARTVFPSDGFDRWFWDTSVLEKLELDAAKFPSFIRPGDAYGAILPAVCELFGFAENVPVITGGPDFFTAILGSGVTKPEQACDRTGSSEGINLCTQNKIEDKLLMSYGHPIKPYWNLSGIINTTGKAVQWCCDLFEISGFEDFFTLARQSKPGSGGLVFLPYLAGERAQFWDSSLRGLWRGINLSSGKAEFVNSVLEGICFSIKDVMSAMEAAGAGDSRVNQLRVTGGLAYNAYLNQLKADITGKEILQPVYKEGELLGLAIIGGCFMGKFSSLAEAVSNLVRVEKRYEPNLKNAELYNKLFEEYKK